MKIKITFLICIFLLVTLYQGKCQVVINEICAANFNDYLDNFNDYEDWVELYNPTGADVNIGAHFISDDIDEPTKWQIPGGTVVPAYGYLIIFCSDRDNTDGGYFHTDFGISQGKQEYIVFADPFGNILDEVWLEIPNQTNHSRGRTTDGANTWSVFLDPTPGAPNANPYQEYAQTPVFNFDGGIYGAGINLEITSPDGYPIYYTLDGSAPDETSTLYTGAIPINETTVVRAVCITDEPLVPSSFIETNTYLINVSHGVKIVSIAGDDVLTLLNGTQMEPIGHIEIFEPNGTLLAEAGGDFNEHGNDSWAYPQRGVDYITRDQFGYSNAINAQLFPGKDREEFKRIILKAAASDNYPFETGGAHIRDAYVQSLSQLADLRMDERTYEPCVMYANGEYWGVYEIREKVDDDHFTDHYYNQGKNWIDFIKTWGGTWEEYGSIDEWDDLHDFILSNDMTDQGNYDYVKDLYNTGSLIDYFILNSYIVCADWLNWNTGWWRGRKPSGDKKKWRYILWDMDASFGHYVNFTNVPDQSANADLCDPEQLGDPGGQGHVPIWNALLQNEEFFSDYINRYSDLSNTYFSCEFMHQHLDSLIALISPEMPGQIDRWGGSMAEWEANVQEIRDFIDIRCSSSLDNSALDCYDQLSGPYNLTVLTFPEGAGSINLNLLELTEFPWTGEYFGGVNIELEAFENLGYTFSHWSVNNGTILPDEENMEIILNLLANDTIIAHFLPDITYDVVFHVEPPMSGTIDVNGFTLPAYPYSMTLPGLADNSLIASPSPGFAFDYWELSNNTVIPAGTDPEVLLELIANDMVTAHFYEIRYDVTFDVYPPEVATIKIGDQELTTFPTTISLPGGVDLIMETTSDKPFYVFDNWQLLHDVSPDNNSSSVVVNFESSDYVIARYIELPNYEVTFLSKPEGAGAVVFGGEYINAFPYTQRFVGEKPTYLKASPERDYQFKKWELQNHLLSNGNEQADGTVTLYMGDTIIVYFDERHSAIYIPNSFTPNGDGLNDIFKVESIEIDPSDFRLTIFDRWGKIMFDTKNINEGWNGSARPGGEYFAPTGVYSYFLRFKNNITTEVKEQRGSLTLIRD